MKEKILAEIERLKDKGKYSDTYDYAFRDGNNGALDAIARFVNSLHEEPVPTPIIELFGKRMRIVLDKWSNCHACCLYELCGQIRKIGEESICCTTRALLNRQLDLRHFELVDD